MRTKVIPVKMTSGESDLLDWLMHRLNMDSRSQVLRAVLVAEAQRSGVNSAELRAVVEERENHPPRRSAKLARLIGTRPRRRRRGSGAA